jgi:hypothetical protein
MTGLRYYLLRQQHRRHCHQCHHCGCDAPSYLESAELIARKNKKKLDVIEQQIHLPTLNHTNTSLTNKSAFVSHRPKDVGEEGDGQPQAADARRSRARWVLQRFELAGGMM